MLGLKQAFMRTRHVRIHKRRECIVRRGEPLTVWTMNKVLMVGNPMTRSPVLFLGA